MSLVFLDASKKQNAQARSCSHHVRFNAKVELCIQMIEHGFGENGGLRTIIRIKFESKTHTPAAQNDGCSITYTVYSQDDILHVVS